MASIGSVLSNPEEGWNRIHMRSPLESLKLVGGPWGYHSGISVKYAYTDTSLDSSELIFCFKGTAIRLINPMVSNRGDLKISIDDMDFETFSCFSSTAPGGVGEKKNLVYEKLGLDDKVHIVSIKWVSGERFSLADIDIIGETSTFPVMVGDQLPQPEEGWRRYDDTDKLIEFSTGWKRVSEKEMYQGSELTTSSKDSSYEFNFMGTSIRLIGTIDSNWDKFTEIAEVYIDDKKVGTINHRVRPITRCGLLFEMNNLELRSHKVRVLNIENKDMSIDAIDINEDGALVPELSRDYEFPIAVIEEEEVDGYAKSLINGEEQLLITPTGKLFLTNGNKGFITVGGEVDLSSYYTKEQIDELIANNLHVHDNASELNKIGEEAGMLTYAGKVVVNNNEYSFRTLPEFDVPDTYNIGDINTGGKLPWLN